MPDLPASQLLMKRINNMIAHLCEASCEWDVRDDVPEYFTAPEGAICDAGLLLPQEEIATSSDPDSSSSERQDYKQDSDQLRTQRILTLETTYSSAFRVAALEIKCCFPRPNKATDGGLYRHSITRSAAQASDAVAFIIYSVLAPDLVACVPRKFLQFCLQSRDSDRKHTANYYFQEHPIVSDFQSPFPMELSPCVMPRRSTDGRDLAACLRSLVRHYNGAEWRNPFNDVILARHNDERASLCDVSVLLPSSSNSIVGEVPFIRRIWQAFETAKKDFHILYPAITPSDGDFVISDTSTTPPSYSIVEIKKKIVLNEQSTWCEFSFTNGERVGLRILAGWRFLLASSKTARFTQYLIPRTAIPNSWFTASVPFSRWVKSEVMTQFQLPKLGSKNFKQYCTAFISIVRTPESEIQTFPDVTIRPEVDGSPPISQICRAGGRSTAQHREKIIQVDDDNDASYERDTSTENNDGLKEDEGDSNYEEEDGDDSNYEERTEAEDSETFQATTASGKGGHLDSVERTEPATTGTQQGVRGDLGKHSAVIWDAAFEVVLRELCRIETRGRLFRLGAHSAGRYVFCDLPASDETDFFHIPLNTPMIYLNFAEVSMTGERIPYDVGRPSAFLHATHGSYRSLYILVNKAPSLPNVRRPNYCYIVPSETINTEQRRTLSNIALRPGRQETNDKVLIFSRGEPLEAYSTLLSNVIAGIRGVMSACDAESLCIGDGITIVPSTYLTTRKNVVHLQMDYFTRDKLYVGDIREKRSVRKGSKVADGSNAQDAGSDADD